MCTAETRKLSGGDFAGCVKRKWEQGNTGITEQQPFLHNAVHLLSEEGIKRENKGQLCISGSWQGTIFLGPAFDELTLHRPVKTFCP